MNIDTIIRVRQLRNFGGLLNKEIQSQFDINNAQYYAITIFADKMQLSSEFLEDNIAKVKEGMKIGEIAEALGFKAEDSLT